MTFAGIAKATERADLLAYLNTLSDNPAPLPTKAAEAPATPPARRAHGSANAASAGISRAREASNARAREAGTAAVNYRAAIADGRAVPGRFALCWRDPCPVNGLAT